MRVTQEQCDWGAAFIATAVDAVQDGTKLQRKKLGPVAANYKRYADDFNTVMPTLKGVVQKSYQTEDFDPLFPYLEECQRTVDVSEEAYRGELDATTMTLAKQMVQLAASEGHLHEFYEPQPAIEQWIKRHAHRIVELMKVDQWTSRGKEKTLARLLMGVMVACHNLMAGAAEYFRQKTDLPPDKTEFSFVARGVAEIRWGLQCTIIREVFARLPKPPARDFGAELETYADYHFRPHTYPSESDMQNVRAALEYLQKDQSLVKDAMTAEMARYVQSEFAETLRSMRSLAPDEHAAQLNRPMLPWGVVVTAIDDEIPGDDGPQKVRVYHVADGMRRQSSLAMTGMPKGVPPEDFAQITEKESEGTFSIRDALLVHLDPAGKHYFRHVERLAPAPTAKEHAEASPVFRAADVKASARVVQHWEQHPDLFQNLAEDGPFVLLPEGDLLRVGCRPESAARVAALTGGRVLPAAQAATLLADVRTEKPWSCVEIADEADEKVDPNDKSDKAWRARIRQKLHGSVPDFSWLEQKLAPFGVGHTLAAGPDSQGFFHRHLGDDEGMRIGTWKELRGSTNITVGYLWGCLRKLKIGTKEFHDSL